MKQKIEQFKNENIAIMFEYQDEYNEFMNVLDRYFIKWISGHKASEFNYFYKYDELCIEYDLDFMSIKYSDKTYYESENIKVITYKEFMDGKSPYIDKISVLEAHTEIEKEIINKINELIEVINER